MQSNSAPTQQCQIRCLPAFYCGDAPIPPESVLRRVRVFARRHMKASAVRKAKAKACQWLGDTAIKSGGVTALQPESPPKFKQGELVRVRSKEQIKSTLNFFGLLNGCMFMPEMEPYCSTLQRVYKVMERFVDERDYHVKKCRGVVLLEGLNCEGTSDYGRCDRACFYFWREEWLEKVEDSPAASPQPEAI